MINRILVALDGSALAEQVLPYVSTLAERSGATVVLATAITAGERWVDQAVTRQWEEEEQAAVQAYLTPIAERFTESGVETRTRVQWGHPADVLQAVADDEGANVIALTTHGRSGFVRWRTGSVADKLLRSASTPVLLIHAQEAAPVERPALRRILVPLDGSALAEAALPLVEDLAEQLGASIILEQAVAPIAGLYAGELTPGSLPVLEDIQAAAGEYLAECAKRIGHHGIKAETRIDFDYPASAIIEAAKAVGADLIALTTHGRSGPERWIMGSVADAVVRHADAPCLVIPSRVLTQDETPEAPAENAALLVGNAVVPPPVWSETPAVERPGPAEPGVRGHRPERSPGR